MSVLTIEGGLPMKGEVQVPGSKNAALAILSSVLLAEGPVVLHNVPEVSDTRIKARLLEHFGAKVEWREGSLLIDCCEVLAGEADEATVRSIRTSFYMLGPLLARVGRVRMPAPGGCKIGARPVDFHVKGLQLMGADIDLTGGVYLAKADRLHGAEIYLDFPSAGATQHLMSAAALAEGSTVIQNAAAEPEITTLADFLNRIGARIEGAGSSTITIQGVKTLHGGEFTVPNDRLQASTYLLAGAITRGDVTVREVMPDTQTALVNKLREAGAEVDEGADWVRVAAPERLRAISVKTMPYPGFPTDVQQPMAATLALADGTSTVEETIYESRIGHIPELNRMGAKIRQEGRSSIISGVERLRGADVEATDLRAGAALVLAGLAAQGRTTVRNVHFIDRGYEDFEGRLRNLGANIERIELPDETATKRGRWAKP
jgi:UDP-N-acetylglucosamine 1-carboxyvinyltransferase